VGLHITTLQEVESGPLSATEEAIYVAAMMDTGVC